MVQGNRASSNHAPQGTATSVSLSGDLDIYALADIERAFATLDGARLVVDLREARSVSAAFFGALVRLRRRLPGSSIEVIGANVNVQRTFRAVGADGFVLLS